MQHILVRERRDDHILPTEGYLLRVVQEVAGLGGDVNFLKHEEEFQINKSFIFDTVRLLIMHTHENLKWCPGEASVPYSV